MRKLHSVVWADADGTGFSPYDPDDDGVPRAYWKTAQRLLTADVVQPPESLPTTLPHPVWSLRRVEVSPLGHFWCFSVQGRGGPFGVAGTCRFVFADAAQWHPAEVWWAAAEAARLDTADEEPDRALLRRGLAALLLDRAQLAVPGSPAQVAGLVGGLLARVPPRVAARWTWVTWPLHRPDSRRHRLVAGHWPEEFREYSPNLARQYDQVLTELPDLADGELAAALPDRRRRAAFEWLVDHEVAEGLDGQPDRLVRDSDAVDLASFIDGIAPTVIVPDWTDVPDELTTEAGRARLARQPALARRWATERPEPALARLREIAAGPDPYRMAAALLTGLTDAQRQTRANLLGLPLTMADAAPTPTRGQQGWPGRLAALLIDLAPEPDRRADLLRDLTAEQSVLHDRDQLAQLHDWLLELGLSPWRHPDLFPDRVRATVSALRTGADLDPAMAALTAAPEPGDLMVAVAQAAGQLAPEPAARLLGAMPRGRWSGYHGRDLERLTDSAEMLTSHYTGYARPEVVEHWLGEMLFHAHDRLHDRTGQQAATYGALRALVMASHGRVRDEYLIRYCERVTPVAKLPEELRRLFPLAAPPVGAVPGAYPQESTDSDARHHATDQTSRSGPDDRGDRRGGESRQTPGDLWQSPSWLRDPRRLRLLAAGAGVVVAAVAVGGYAVWATVGDPPDRPTATGPVNPPVTVPASRGPAGSPEPVPSGTLPATEATAGPPTGEPQRYDVTFRWDGDGDEQRLSEAVMDSLAPAVTGRQVQHVRVVGYAANEETALRWTTQLEQLTKARVPALAAVPFEHGWSKPRAKQPAGTLLVTAYYTG